MADRHQKKRAKPVQPDARPADPFALFGLSANDFVIESGGGKSILNKQRVIWITVRHRTTGRTISGKIGTSKKRADRQYDELLRTLLGSFRRT